MTPIERIKKLRQETGLSMVLIKEAVEKEHDYESALTYLKQFRQEDKHDQVGKKRYGCGESQRRYCHFI